MFDLILVEDDDDYKSYKKEAKLEKSSKEMNGNVLRKLALYYIAIIALVICRRKSYYKITLLVSPIEHNLLNFVYIGKCNVLNLLN